MKYLKLFESFDESKIHEICKRYHIYNYIINKDGSIDVDGDVYLVSQCLDKLPLIFNKVDGFNCSSNHLTTLEGFPKIINSASCADNLLTSFKYLPKEM